MHSIQFDLISTLIKLIIPHSNKPQTIVSLQLKLKPTGNFAYKPITKSLFYEKKGNAGISLAILKYYYTATKISAVAGTFIFYVLPNDQVLDDKLLLSECTLPQ